MSLEDKLEIFNQQIDDSSFTDFDLECYLKNYSQTLFTGLKDKGIEIPPIPGDYASNAVFITYCRGLIAQACQGKIIV
jgi:hypothetical protein